MLVSAFATTCPKKERFFGVLVTDVGLTELNPILKYTHCKPCKVCTFYGWVMLYSMWAN